MKTIVRKLFVFVIVFVGAAEFACVGCASLRDPQVANPAAAFCEQQLCQVKQIQDESVRLGIDCAPYARAVCTIGIVLAPFAAAAIAQKKLTEADLGKARDAAWTALSQLRTSKVQP